MRIFTQLFEIRPAQFQRPVATVGVFDGLHLGHQAILADLRKMTDKVGGEGVVLTFDRHPDLTLKGSAPPCILSLPHRLIFLRRCGADNVIIVPFDQAMASVTAAGFVREILKGRLGAVGLVMGPGNNFGRGGEGDATLVRGIGEEHGIVVRETPAVSIRGQQVSSSAIRTAIAKGDLETAAAMLGRRVTLLGEVVKGAGRGKTIGFPTANLDIGDELRPPNGVYLATTMLHQRVYRSLVNIGVRPTFDESAPTVEVHLLDFKGDLYGLTIEVSFHKRLRDEKKFAKVSDLVVQLKRDREAALAGLAPQRRR